MKRVHRGELDDDLREGVRVDLHRPTMNEAIASEPASMAARATELFSQFGPAGTGRSTPLAAVEQRRQLRRGEADAPHRV